MIVVKVELWPYGDDAVSKRLGTLVITNDGTGDSNVGSYFANWVEKGDEHGQATRADSVRFTYPRGNKYLHSLIERAVRELRMRDAKNELDKHVIEIRDRSA